MTPAAPQSPRLGLRVRWASVVADGAPIERVLFALTVVLASGLVWLAPRPPMIDLPQHAAQIALWRDLISGTSRWADLVRINLLTPYLIGYGLTLPLSFVLPLNDAVRVILTLDTLGFVLGCMGLRRQLGGDARLDWLFLFGFFGFAWQWGFMTFLVAAPVALGFLILAHRYASCPTAPRALGLMAAGVVLLFSHGLLFIMGLALGWPMALRSSRGRATLLRVSIPFVLLGCVCVIFRLASSKAEGAMRFDAWTYGGDLWLKPFASLIFVSGTDLAAGVVPFALTLLVLCAPRIRGSVLNRSGALLLFAGLVLLIMALPSYAFQTAFLFHRFSLFLLPFFALMFRPPDVGPRPSQLWTMLPIFSAIWLMLGIEGYRIHAFAAESASFETVLDAADPGRRALALIYDPASTAAGNAFAYLHYPSWYQAEKAGFVDFNFAVFHPQIVRFRPGMDPDLTPALSRYPARFDATHAEGRLYDYYFVRGSQDDLRTLRRQSHCTLVTRAADGPWSLLERGACGP